MSLEFQQVLIADVTLIEMSGRLDTECADGFAKRLSAAMAEGPAPARLVVGLGGLSYISSAGLHVLMRTAREAKSDGGTLVAAAPGEFVAEVLRISRFDLVIDVFPTVGEAIASVSAAAARAYAEAGGS